jgi:hypothetical protein
LTNLVEHQIHLKPDAVSKHQRPYKLPPHKRDVFPSFEPVSNPEFGRFLLETKIMGLEMGICSFSFTGAILP